MAQTAVMPLPSFQLVPVLPCSNPCQDRSGIVSLGATMVLSQAVTSPVRVGAPVVPDDLGEGAKALHSSGAVTRTEDDRIPPLAAKAQTRLPASTKPFTPTATGDPRNRNHGRVDQRQTSNRPRRPINRGRWRKPIVLLTGIGTDPFPA